MKISVVIPCLDEEKTISICVKKCRDSFSKMQIDGEVIVVDNGSSDDSAKLAQIEGAKVVHCVEKGYGSAIRCGFETAQGDYVLIADADNSYDFGAIADFYNVIVRTNSDMVIGSRFKGKIHKDAMPFLHRYLGTPVLTLVLNILYGTKISDSQCGMRMFKKESLDKINFETVGMDFASELLIKFSLAKMKVTEIPIELFKDGRERKGHLRPWRDGLNHLATLFRCRFSV